jgi:hypothetical protein
LISVHIRKGEQRERGDLDLYKVGAGDQAYARAPRAASTPLGVSARRVAGPVLDAGEDDVELEGKDVLGDVGAGGEGLEGHE